jgi:hypothetical protein
MKRSFSRHNVAYVALAAVATGGAALTFQSCRTVPGSEVREAIADGPEYSGVKLRMTGDEVTGLITAVFSFDNSEFNPGDSVELRYDVVRSLVEPRVNCSALRGKTTVVLQGDGKQGRFEKTVDRKLFDTPVRADPDGDAKADMDLLKDSGGPLRVEGCLMKPGTSKPLASAKATTSAGMNLQDSPDAPIHEYAKICAERLGEIPAFSCLDESQFKEIPITVTDAAGNTTKPDTRVDKCDNPIYLPTGSHGYCKPWARIGHLKISDDVSAAVVCRRYWTPNYPQPTGINDPLFNDVAIIQHNRKTGETCWFQALGKLYAGRVPPPTEKEVPAAVLTEHPQATDAKSFWLPPRDTANINCVSCHDADQWMHSPYVRQAKDDNGNTWLPSAPRGKYIMLGGKFGFDKWATTYSVTPEASGDCVSCHRIGSMKGCEKWAADAGGVNIHLAQFKTEFGKSYPQSHWMPTPDYGDYESLESWNGDLAEAHKAILDCCNVRRPDGSKILGQKGEFQGAVPYYGKVMSDGDKQILEAAGCRIKQISEVRETF